MSVYKETIIKYVFVTEYYPKHVDVRPSMTYHHVREVRGHSSSTFCEHQTVRHVYDQTGIRFKLDDISPMPAGDSLDF